MSKLQNLLHVFETMINTQMILESNFNEDEENFAMLDDFDDSITDLCHTIMQLVIEGERPNDPRVLQKVYDKLKDTPLPPSKLTLFHEVLDKINNLW